MQYKVVAMPYIQATSPQDASNKFADMLEKHINDMAKKGWTFKNVEVGGSVVLGGCLRLIGMGNPAPLPTYAAVFYKE